MNVSLLNGIVRQADHLILQLQSHSVAQRAIFLVASEALCFTALTYHILAMATKALPWVAKCILQNIPIATVQRIGQKIPNWATWNQVRLTHAKPLMQMAVCTVTCASTSVTQSLPKLTTIFVPRLPILDQLFTSFFTRRRIALVAGCVAVALVVAVGVVLIWKERQQLQKQAQRIMQDKADCEAPENLGIGKCSSFINQQDCQANGGVWSPPNPHSYYSRGTCLPQRDHTSYKQKCQEGDDYSCNYFKTMGGCTEVGGEWNAKYLRCDAARAPLAKVDCEAMEELDLPERCSYFTKQTECEQNSGLWFGWSCYPQRTVNAAARDCKSALNYRYSESYYHTLCTAVFTTRSDCEGHGGVWSGNFHQCSPYRTHLRLSFDSSESFQQSIKAKADCEATEDRDAIDGYCGILEREQDCNQYNGVWVPYTKIAGKCLSQREHNSAKKDCQTESHNPDFYGCTSAFGRSPDACETNGGIWTTIRNVIPGLLGITTCKPQRELIESEKNCKDLGMRFSISNWACVSKEPAKTLEIAPSCSIFDTDAAKKMTWINRIQEACRQVPPAWGSVFGTQQEAAAKGRYRSASVLFHPDKWSPMMTAEDREGCNHYTICLNDAAAALR